MTSKKKAMILLVAKYDVAKEYGVNRNDLKKLVDTGYMVETKGEKVGRGRASIKYELTSKGKGFLNLAKGWKKKAI